MKTLLIKDNKKREAALKNEAGGDEKCVFFYLALVRFLVASLLVYVLYEWFRAHETTANRANVLYTEVKSESHAVENSYQKIWPRDPNPDGRQK